MTVPSTLEPLVAHICDEFLPLSETFIYQFIKSMRTTHPLIVYSHRTNIASFPMLPENLYQVHSVSRWSIRGFQATLLRKTGFDAAADKMSTSYYRLFQTLKPAIVHAHFGPQACRVVRATERLKIPLIVSYYGYDLSSLLYENRWKCAYKVIFEQADACIALSKDFRQRLLKLGCPEKKIHIIRLGVDPIAFPYRQPPNRQPQTIRLLGVARCVEKKGVDSTLNALAIVRKRFPNIHYTHIGDGPLLALWKAKAEKLGLSDICDWQGSRPREAVQQAMHDSHLFILPSVRASNGDEEGTPTVLYEAMATGLPILSTLHSGIPEMVENGCYGYLCHENDVQALATNTIHMIENVAEWPRITRIARQRVETEFDVHKEATKLENLYRSIFTKNVFI